MKKSSNRSMSVITRQDYDQQRSDHWMEELSNSLSKQSVQSKNNANKSIYDQISAIMGNKSKYSSVEAAVDDMQERSGMKDFLNKLQSQGEEPSAKMKASAEAKILKDVPQIKETINNYCEDTYGNIPIPAIVEKIKSIHKNDVIEDADWDDNEFLQYINNVNIDAKKKHPNEDLHYKNLGKTITYDADRSNQSEDVFQSLTPSTK